MTTPQIYLEDGEPRFTDEFIKRALDAYAAAMFAMVDPGEDMDAAHMAAVLNVAAMTALEMGRGA